MKKRVISAIVALIIIIPLLIIGGTIFYIAASILGVIGYNEILHARETKRKLPILMKFIGSLSFILIILSSLSELSILQIDLKIISIITLLILLPLSFSNKKNYNIEDAFYLLASTIFLGISFGLLISIRNMNLSYILYIAVITIMSDTFAHFWGTKIGKHKLCPHVSPNKTIEGAIGGTIMGTLLGTIFYTSVFDYTSVFTVIIISFVLSIIGQCGDLIFSAIKRNYEIKDFGNIMPGHGGILDRLDSILTASIAFIILMNLL